MTSSVGALLLSIMEKSDVLRVSSPRSFNRLSKKTLASLGVMPKDIGLI